MNLLIKPNIILWGVVKIVRNQIKNIAAIAGVTHSQNFKILLYINKIKFA